MVCPEVYNFIKKKTLAQVFSCEFCGISKNNFFTEHLWATASIFKHLRSVQYFALDYRTSPMVASVKSFRACKVLNFKTQFWFYVT